MFVVVRTVLMWTIYNKFVFKNYYLREALNLWNNQIDALTPGIWQIIQEAEIWYQ